MIEPVASGVYRVPSRGSTCDHFAAVHVLGGGRGGCCANPPLADELLSSGVWLGRCGAHLGRPVRVLPNGQPSIQWHLGDSVSE